MPEFVSRLFFYFVLFFRWLAFLFVQFDLISFTCTIPFLTVLLFAVYLCCLPSNVQVFQNFIYIVTSVPVRIKKTVSHVFHPFYACHEFLIFFVSHCIVCTHKFTKAKTMYIFSKNRTKIKKKRNFFSLFTKKTICYLSFSYELRQDCYD